MEKKKQPNILVLMVDQERYPSVYETKELEKWRKENLVTQNLLRKNGMEFLNHYAGSTACSPSRATIYTGQYPSLHGVTQTTGVAKGPFDPDVFWLDPNTVPTIGNYFRTAGYQTYWKGKWHASDEDILIPGTHNAFPSYDPDTGVPSKEKEEIYQKANRLDPFGFSGWIGPEPHGSNPRNSGSSAAIGTSGRDQVYALETVKLIQSLEEQSNKNNTPWFIMCSFVNPHDIALYGVLTALSPAFNFEVDPTLPPISPAPTARESLSTKPQAQESYRITYPQALQPIIEQPFYRQLYYSLQKQADTEMNKVFHALKNSTFYENTIVLFTSDHGELLGAHGGLHQKWYNMYEESIHVPLIIHSPQLFSQHEQTNMLTSHVDILPTLLGLANIDVEKIQEKLSKSHTEVHPLVGRNLTPLIQGNDQFFRANEPLYFMSDDDITKGLNQMTASGVPYESVVQPNHIEAIITRLKTGKDHEEETWKFARYYDNPQFWSDPGCSDSVWTKSKPVDVNTNTQCSICVNTTKTEPVPSQYELYNLTTDPLEEINYADPSNVTPETTIIQELLTDTLEQQCNQKRIEPSSGEVPGMPSCNCKED
ncbi:sulfatase-like hydrolase/transferase [Bacillus sp. V3B]|uniref:sulfatase-like hydrolase/transferase n=1 Tax=Bacillus sp. V3B TaxID=2804915 RepID=UPI00210929C2|nr:sulfatase-like hydrolase/transferase [Bacillus sp. V3B]MCQ6276786.1 sulfatase-like hydrolase/transferase [Bacillus sp. V3B]